VFPLWYYLLRDNDTGGTKMGNTNEILEMAKRAMELKEEYINKAKGQDGEDRRSTLAVVAHLELTRHNLAEILIELS
jgi:hypothetical protein